MSERIVKIDMDDEANISSDLQKAVDVILSGGSVAIPTESFYGLAVNAFDEEAIKKIFEIKGREIRNPILILISSLPALQECVAEIPEIADELIRKFWPGGLTIIFKAKPGVISPKLTAGTGKIGIRLSSHPIPNRLSKLANVPITGTSANLSGESSCMTGEDVFKSLGNRVDLILDCGKTDGGIGSTVIDITVEPPKILRKGMVDEKSIKEVICCR